MNENLTNAVADLITRAVSGVDTAKEFLVAETPEVVQQLLMWNTTKYAVVSVVLFLVTLAFIKGGVWNVKRVREVEKTNKENRYRKYSDYNYEDPGPYGVTAVLAFCFAGGTAITFFVFALQFVKITIAPKLWLLEYATNLIK